ncbi:protein FAR-RED IMPAIRED RESPONSE 1-like [Abrus precatorius]|uniref:Protein FAR-RED IMPAIRED RESPONSE 1-like n=1 Tax=Abrus precatorius TaxID=3816 RepID=A0A8B8K2E3_ABRPR|nr:protein FAR-RED IMPAIRED RESPONSE 1-like [Abrus precatorius]
MHVRRTLDLHNEVGVRINKTFQTLVHDVVGHDNLKFVEENVRNYINKERRLIAKEGDSKALVDYFCRMKEENSQLWYDINVDEDFRIKNIFWADARSRAAYESFGDIVSFDTTYLTNKYDMPFAAFVGVNHHGQLVLLGCSLISTEDTKTFVWLFNCWLRCMCGKAPNGIVTDQCKAMQNAITIALPNTQHRWCL